MGSAMNNQSPRVLLAIVTALMAVDATPTFGQSARWETVTVGDATIEVGTLGVGPTLVMLPSLGRGAEDFLELAGLIAAEGFRVVLPQPRGIRRSVGPMDGLAMHDLAADVAGVIRHLDVAPAVVVGHAFGNRVARTVSTDYPNLVDKVVLLAAGGMVPMEPEISDALRACFDLSLPIEERLAFIDLAFFADGNDPAVWVDGWYPDTSESQRMANRVRPVEEWWGAGAAEILIVQGMADRIAVPENAELLAREYGQRVSVVKLEGMGHAMLPERPQAIAQAILDFVR